ncbi:MAG: hypothetical protein SGI77_21775 [Pirellulaceae bacterium]|nr:hypothetical protein [Pirellulaceae bacterium]
MQTVYIETSIVSFLRENPNASPDSVMRQEITRAWWDFHRHRYSLVTAQYVVDDANAGNATLAAERIEHLHGVPLLPIGEELDRLASEILLRPILPADALDDFELPFPVICTPKDMLDEYENEINK